MRQHRLTDTDVAIECGVSRQAVGAWRLGSSFPGDQFAPALAQLLGAEATRILYEGPRPRRGRPHSASGDARALARAARVLRARGKHQLAEALEEALEEEASAAA